MNSITEANRRFEQLSLQRAKKDAEIKNALSTLSAVDREKVIHVKEKQSVKKLKKLIVENRLEAIPYFEKHKSFLLDARFKETKDTPLTLAISLKNHKLAKFFLNEGVDPSIKNKSGDNALLLSVRNRMLKITKLVLEKSDQRHLDIKDTIDANGLTPMMIAVLNRDAETISILLEHGADFQHIEDNDGRTAFSLTRDIENPIVKRDIVSLFKNQKISCKDCNHSFKNTQVTHHIETLYQCSECVDKF